MKPVVSFSQTATSLTDSITLKAVIEIARLNSFQVLEGENLYLSSYWQYKAFKAGSLPLLGLNTIPIDYNRALVKRYNSEENIDVYRLQQTISSSLGFSISQRIGLTGGSIFALSDLNRLRNLGEMQLTQYSITPIVIGYEQSLFGYNPFKWKKIIEPLKYKRAMFELTKSIEDASEQCTTLFFNLVLAQLQFENSKTNLANADTLYNIGLKRFEITSITQSDLFTLKVQQLNERNSLSIAKRELVKAQSNLSAFLRLPTRRELKPILPNELPKVKVSSEEALKFALSNSPELKQNEELLLEAQSLAEQAKFASQFNASIRASFGLNGLDTSFNEAFKKPLNQQNINISFNIPLIDWGVARGKYNMARKNSEVVKAKNAQIELDFQQNVIMAVEDFNAQEELIQIAKEAESLAEQAYNISRQRFIVGKEDFNSLFLTLTRKDQAKRDYAFAIKDYWQYYFRLRKLTLYDFENNLPIFYDFSKFHNLKN